VKPRFRLRLTALRTLVLSAAAGSAGWAAARDGDGVIGAMIFAVVIVTVVELLLAEGLR